MSWFSGVWGGCGHSESIRNVCNYYKPLENRPTCPGCITNTTPDAFRAHERILGELGGATYLGADAGRASLYDLALLSAMYGMFGGFLHAAAMIGSAGIPAAEFTPLVVSWLNAMAGGLPAMAEAIDAGDHSAGDSNLEMQALGYVNLLNASTDQGVGTELVEPMGTLLDRAIAAGLGDGDISALIALLGKEPVART